MEIDSKREKIRPQPTETKIICQNHMSLHIIPSYKLPMDMEIFPAYKIIEKTFEP
jgi:hypothetical protein